MGITQLFINNFSGHVAFGVIVISIFMLGFLIHLIRTRHLHKFATSLLITTGIFFTFLGISMGLVGFDVNNIDESLPTLINGIKTAFLVSVFGVASAIFLKILSFIFELLPTKQIIDDTELDISDLIASQNQILNAIKDGNKAIIGDEDSSLIGQIKNLRTDMNDKIKELCDSAKESKTLLENQLQNQKDYANSIKNLQENLNSGFNELIKEFRDFAKTMAENNSKVLVEALRDVIKDFNDKITEQFGDNFKELNIAVGNLLIWQEKYKEYIESSQESLTTIQSAIESQSNDYKTLANSTTGFIASVDEIFQTTQGLKEQRELIEQNIKNLAQYLQNLQNTIPNLIDNFDRFSNKSIDILNNMSREFTNYAQNISQKSSQIQDSFESSTKALVDGFNNNLDQLDNEFNNYNERLNTQLIEALNKSAQSINSQAKVLDSELENSLKNIAQNIASISSKFIDDYKVITTSLNYASKELLDSMQGRRR